MTMLNRPLAPVRGDVVPDEQEDQSRQTRCDRQSQTEPAYLSDTTTVIIFHLSAGNIRYHYHSTYHHCNQPDLAHQSVYLRPTQPPILSGQWQCFLFTQSNRAALPV